MSRADWQMDLAPCSDEGMRYFTVAQANRSLVLVRRIVEDVVREYGLLIELEELIDAAESSGRYEALETARQKLVTTVDTLQTCLEELEQLGVELKDFARGIVDFPAHAQGRPIRLCWMRGEDQISHWHEAGAGFACRQPVALLSRPDVFEPDYAG